MTPKPLATGLPARIAAQEVLGWVLRRRRPLDEALEVVLGAAGLEARDAGFARAIATETLRRLGQLQALIHSLVAKMPPEHRAGPALEILLAGGCELLFLKTSPHAAVDAANELASRDSKAVHFKPLINAVLRRIAREGEAAIGAQDASRLNMPDWLWSRWCAAYGEDSTRQIGAVHFQMPPLDIRLKGAGDRESAIPAAEFQLPNAQPLPGGMVRLYQTGRVDNLSGYAEGEWWVQDFAAAMPVRLLGNVRGSTVIDLCAAPGGKCAQLAAAGANVIAVERDPARMQRLKANLERLRLSADLVEADVRDFVPRERAPFVLLDAPCSATGTVRRHPDLPWIKSAADVNACAAAAAELLEAAAEMVEEGGLLVFAVCSLEPEEGVEQVNAFLTGNPEFRREPLHPKDVLGMSELLCDGDLRTLPCHLSGQGGMDGFYAARLRRSGR